MPKTHIALFYGGWSNERFISQATARNLLLHFDTQQYTVHPVDVRREGFYLAHPDDEASGIPIDKGTMLLPYGDGYIRPALAFIAIHGTPGEDGLLQQGWLDMAGIPYTGCNALTSQLCFHKYHTKLWATHLGLTTADFLYLKGGHDVQSSEPVDWKYASGSLGKKMIVKPCRSGSSFGTSLVQQESEFATALPIAQEDDREVLIEQYLEGTEYTVALYLKANGVAVVLPAMQRKAAVELAFSTKDDQVWKREHLEPTIEPAIQKRLASWCQDAYEKMSLRGPVRFDVIHRHADDAICFLEVNTVPGMTAKSIFTQQLEMAAIPMQDFLTDVVEEALRGD